MGVWLVLVTVCVASMVTKSFLPEVAIQINVAIHMREMLRRMLSMFCRNSCNRHKP